MRFAFDRVIADSGAALGGTTSVAIHFRNAAV